MRVTTWIGVVLLVFAACKKKEEQKAEPPPKVVDKQEPEPVAPADIPVTSKSPEAVNEFELGIGAAHNGRNADAIMHFRKAIELDPGFAQAHADLGFLLPGAEGTDLLAKAGTLGASLPEAEKQWILAGQAWRSGDLPKARAALAKVLELAPGAWRADMQLAQAAIGERDFATATKRLEHALSVKPDLPFAHNLMAYANALQRNWDKAIASAKKQVDLLPKEPNPHDTLAEVLLWSGKFEEAEKEFNAAVTLDPTFFLAWQGVGIARAYRGDFKGAYEAFDKRTDSTAPGEKFEARLDRAWLSLAEDKLPQAIAALDEIEKDPEAQKLPIYAFASLERGHIYMHAGKHADAAKAYATALKRADELAGDGKKGLLRGHRIATLRLAALTGKPAPDADKHIAAFEAEAKETGENPTTLSWTAFAKGLALWAKKDAKGAIAELSKCDGEFMLCRYDLAALQRKEGDKAGADATEKQLKEIVRRESSAVYLHSRLGKQ